MREIKFRIWDKKNKKWATDFTLSLTGELLCDEGSTLFIRDDFVLMQYTGLKDIEGKEIYEGYLLRYSVQGDVQNEYYHVENMWDLRSGLECADPYYRIDRSSLKVIGNIYENPELLEKNHETYY